MHTITVIHPSRGRAQMAFNAYKMWRQNAHTDFQYILSVDNDDAHNYWKGPFCDLQDGNALMTMNDNKSAIEAINVAVQHATGDILIVISDDFLCRPNWDINMLRMLDRFEGTDYLVKTDDGLQPTLVTLPILGRGYYERFGYIYHPGYKHMFCDQEMTAVAIMTDKYIKLPLKFEHAHYTTGAMQKDLINIKNDATWNQGEDLFNERLKSNFGLKPEEIVKSYQEIVWR